MPSENTILNLFRRLFSFFNNSTSHYCLRTRRQKLRGFAYRNHIMVEHNQPDGLVSRYEYDRYDIDDKVLKSSNNLDEEWTFDYRKDHTVVTDTYNTTATTPWRKSAIGQPKTVKAANKPTTSTATKSASRER